MSPDGHTSNRFRELRSRAEALLAGRGDPGGGESELPRLIHELEVHQIELELQNQELRQAQAELEASRDRFADLYESAPVGYVTLNAQGLIERANTAAHEILGFEHQMPGTPLSRFLDREDHPVFYRYLNELAGRERRPDPVEVRVTTPGVPSWARLEAAVERQGDGSVRSWRVALADVTRRRRAEEDLKRAEERARNESEARRRLAGRLVDLLEEDRRRLAMMLHDEVGQELSGAKMEIEIARRDASPDSKLLRRLDRAARILGEAIVCLRDTGRELRPPSLDVLGLVPALRSLGRRAPSAGCRVRHFFKDVPETLEDHLQSTVFRIAQEAVANAVRHSGCSEVHLSLTVRDQALHLTVEDDGCGFVWEEAVSEGSGRGPLGLLIMRERAVFAGGSLEVDSTPGRGTLVTAKVPLTPPPGGPGTEPAGLDPT